MTIKNNMLLVSDKKDSSWLSALIAAIAPFGYLQIAPMNEAMDLIRQGTAQLIIVDAAEVDDVPALVAGIRALRPETRVVVVTASPTWRRAREAFQAGATDYIRKSLSQKKLRAAFSEALKKMPLP